eukprot:COSAG01_NODE_82_length_27810_cov_36.968352_19_plen_221_part_00
MLSRIIGLGSACRQSRRQKHAYINSSATSATSTDATVITGFETRTFVIIWEGWLPWLATAGVLDATAGFSAYRVVGALMLAALALLVLGETHFYWSHRLLHTRWLYQSVHKIHHESINPDPLIGLSMHWVESAIYFSASPLIAVFFPMWIARLMLKMLVLAPLQGHHGHSITEDGLVDAHSRWHYIHHAKFNWNYGANPVWDVLMGTQFQGDLKAKSLKS